MKLIRSLLGLAALAATLPFIQAAPVQAGPPRPPAHPCVLDPSLCNFQPTDEGVNLTNSCPPGYVLISDVAGGLPFSMCVPGTVGGGSASNPPAPQPAPRVQCRIRQRAFTGPDESSLTLADERWTRNCAPYMYTVTPACDINPPGTMVPFSYQLGWDRGYRGTSTITQADQRADVVSGTFPCDVPVCIGVGCGAPDPDPATSMVIDVTVPTVATTGGSLRPVTITASPETLTCLVSGVEVPCPPSAKGPFVGEVVLDIDLVAPAGALNCNDPRVCDYFIVEDTPGNPATLTVWFFTATGLGEEYFITVNGSGTQTYVQGNNTLEVPVPFSVNPGQGDASFTVKSASPKPING